MIIKWLGGKRRLVPTLRQNMISSAPDVLVEPFVGGGALFFALRRDGWNGTAWLGDRSAAVIAVLRSVRDRTEEVIRQLQVMAADYRGDPAGAYARWMAEQPPEVGVEHLPIQQDEQEIRLAAWTLAVNRTCFNGLWRVNAKGRFNSPFGRYPSDRDIVRERVLREAAAALKGARLIHGDFDVTLSKALDRPSAGKTRQVYVDPPYLPLGATSSFTGYAAGGFKLADHERLMASLARWSAQGVAVLGTNAMTPKAMDLAQSVGFHWAQGPALRRGLAARSSARGWVRDLIFRSDAPVIIPEEPAVEPQMEAS